MEYVKPSTRVSRMNIAASLLAGSGVVTSVTDNVSVGGNGNQSASDDNSQAGGNMLARGRRMFIE